MGASFSLAVIPDGNRRFAKKHHLSLHQAYAKGFSKVTQLLEWVKPLPIESTTLWALSLENFKKRSALEIRLLFRLMQRELDASLQKIPDDFPSVRFIGRTDLLPKSVQKRMEKLEAKTENNARRFNIAVAYSGREEIVHAARLAAQSLARGEIERIDDAAIESNLYQPQPVDLLIRTGDVQRMSGFMPWQNAYAEVYFSKKLWPEFSHADFNQAVSFYQGTDRRFGK